MSLSLIIPACDAAMPVAATLDNLQPLRGRGAEIIVINGGADIAAVIQGRVEKLLNVAGPRAQQMNAGAAAARGEILCFLHAGSLLPEGADGLMIGGLARSRRSWGCFNVRSGGTHPLRQVIAQAMNLRAWLSGIADGAQGLFVTRSLFEAAGRFPEIARGEDRAFSRRLKIYGRPLRINHALTLAEASRKTTVNK